MRLFHISDALISIRQKKWRFWGIEVKLSLDLVAGTDSFQMPICHHKQTPPLNVGYLAGMGLDCGLSPALKEWETLETSSEEYQTALRSRLPSPIHHRSEHRSLGSLLRA